MLFPERSQILDIVPDNKQISALAFTDQCTGENLNSGESSTDARVLEQAWDESLDFSSYVQAGEETISARVLEANQVTVTLADGSFQPTFKITGESPFAIFEFSTPNSDTVVGKKLYVKFAALKKESSFGLVAGLTTGEGTGVDFENAFIISNAFPTKTAVNLTALVGGASAEETLTYTTVTSATDTTGTAIDNPASALNDQDGTSVVVKVVDSGSLEVKAKTIFLKLSFASATLEPSTIYADQSDKGSAPTAPIVVPDITSDASLTLTNFIAAYDGSVTYDLEREGEDSIRLSSDTALKLGENFDESSGVLITSDTPWLIKVSCTPSGGTTATEFLYFQVTFTKAASKFALKASLPDDRTASGSGTGYTDPFVISGIFPANTTVNLKDFVDENSASAAANLTYTIVTSAADEEGTPIANARLANQVGKSVVVRVFDKGSLTIYSKKIYLSLAFTTAVPTSDDRYSAALLRGGAEVQLTGSMATREISFSVGLLPGSSSCDDDIVIYSFFNNIDIDENNEFALFYDNEGLKLYASHINTDVIKLLDNFPAGTYDFTLRKTPSANGYTVTILVEGLTLNNNTFEVKSDFDAFFNPVIGADVRNNRRRSVKVVHRVAWTFQPSALVSRFGGTDFSRLTNDASVGSTFVVRVPCLAAGESLDLFSVTGSANPVSLGTKTVEEGESSLEFEVKGTDGTSYEFLVRAADSNESLLNLPRSVKVTVDTSVRAKTAAFTGLNNVAALQNNSANLQKLTVIPPDGGFKVGDKIYLYELNSSNEKVAIGESTALLYEVTGDSSDAQELSLSEIPFENKV